MSIEYASYDDRRIGGQGGAAASLRNAPAWVIDRVNVARARCGLPQIGNARQDDHRESVPSVRWDPASKHRPAGAALTVSGGAAGSTRGRQLTRVMLVCAYGTARAADIRRRRPESIMRDAFGTADELNRDRGLGITAGHGGAYLAFVGPALRALDSDVGLILSWLPDMSRVDHRQAVEAIERGELAASVNMIVRERSTLPIGQTTDLVKRAKLLNVALVPNPAYRGAVAKVFRNSWEHDAGELRKQIDAVIGQARFAERAARGWVA